jgi:archaemetzincin
MNLLHVLPVGKVDRSVLEELCVALSQYLRVDCEILPFELDPAPLYHPERQQYHSSEIIGCMHSLVQPEGWRLLGVTAVDLYIPILQYVFGEAQMGGPCALVSLHRLRQEFYGLDRDDSLLGQRLLKEAIHELGHTFDLCHCQDYRCAMASAHAVEWIDLRENGLCDTCLAQVKSCFGHQHPVSLFYR